MTDVLDSVPFSPDLRRASKLHYQVTLPDPASHLFEITLHLAAQTEPILNLKFPVWTPGSYLVREYAKHLQDFRAMDQGGQALAWQKLSKNHWQIQTPQAGAVTIRYRIFAHELTVRTNHLDHSHGYFNPGAMFFYLPGQTDQGITLTVIPPDPNWRVTTALEPVPGAQNTFWADCFDTLADSPCEIGTHHLHEFEVLGKPHQWAIWGVGNYDLEQIVADTQKIIATEADIFGGLPYERYLFLLHLSANGYGGLEHHNCCSLLYPRFGFRDLDQYHRFMGLVAHEFFHLWNVKRIRPQALQSFDYDQENYTEALWFCEGATSFYDLIIPYRAGIYDAQVYLKLVSASISRLQATPGRQVQSLLESSFDTWIKLYRPDANSRNSQVSYYLKGELVFFLLDLLIRDRHNNQRSLDDVMRRLWCDHGPGQPGYSLTQLKAVMASVAGVDLTEFWQNYIQGTQELDYQRFLQPFGLHLVADDSQEAPPYLGITVQNQGDALMIQGVDVDSPGQRAGLKPGSQLVAIANFRVPTDQLQNRLRDYQSGDQITVTVFDDDQLVTLTVTLADPRPTAYQIKPLPQPTDSQRQKGQQWLDLDFTAGG